MEQGRTQNIESCKECLMLLATELFKKIQFAYNAAELASFDNAAITTDVSDSISLYS